MTDRPLHTIRRLLALTGAAVCISIMIFTIDSLTSRFREKFNVIPIVAGASEELTGLMPEGAKTINDLDIFLGSDKLSLEVHESYSGFWFGGEMWRATLRVAADSPVSAFDLRIKTRNSIKQQPDLVYRVDVFPDIRSLNLAGASFTARILGVSPVRLSLYLLPALVVLLAMNYLIGLASDRILLRQGFAEVFMVRANGGNAELAFGLGTAHGAAVGRSVAVLDKTGREFATAEIIAVLPKDSVASLPLHEAIGLEPGMLVRLGA